MAKKGQCYRRGNLVLTHRDPRLNQNRGEPATFRYPKDLLGEFPPIRAAQPPVKSVGGTAAEPSGFLSEAEPGLGIRCEVTTYPVA